MRKYPILILIMIASLIIVAWFLYQISPPSHAAKEVVPIIILSGSPGRNDIITSTAHSLYWNGLVRSESITAFLIYLFTLGEDKPLELGTHYIQKGVNVFRIIKQIRNDPNISDEEILSEDLAD